jgi:hypothetical protein
MKKAMFLIAIASVQFLSCAKDNGDDPPVAASPAIGFWKGSYTTTGQLGSSNYAFLIKPNGLGRVYDLGTKTDTALLVAAEKADLVWVLNGNTLQTTYTTGTKTVNTTGNLNAAQTSMDGTWAFGATVKGNIALTKQ